MKYTKDAIVVTSPSKKLVELMMRLHHRKMEEVEKMRKMKPEEFSVRVLM